MKIAAPISCLLLLMATLSCDDPPVELLSECDVSSPSLVFGTVLVGGSSEQAFTVTASGTGALGGSVELATTSSCDDFSILEGAGRYDLSPGESIEVRVQFSPTSTGSKSCAVSLGDGVCSSVSLSGAGDVSAQCQISRTTVDFGQVLAGSPAVIDSFTITNSGGDTLSGDVTISSGSPCDAFEIVARSGPFALTQGESLEVVVAFAPDTTGTQVCRIETAAGECGDIELTGYRFPRWVALADNDFSLSCDVTGGWNRNRFLRDVAYLSNDLWLAVGYDYDPEDQLLYPCSYVMASFNNGRFWEEVFDQGFENFDFNAISASTSQDFVAVGGGGTVMLIYYGDIGADFPWFSSTEGMSGTTANLTDVSMKGAYGITVGSGTILLTTDGGSNWTPAPESVSAQLQAVDMTDANSATAVGNGGTVLRTDDGGASWDFQFVGSTQDFLGVDFVDRKTGVVVGRNGALFRTADGGATWSDHSVSTFDFYDVSFSDPDNGIAVGSGVILRTIDGGTTWRQELLPEPASLGAAYLLEPALGIVTGTGGDVFRLE